MKGSILLIVFLLLLPISAKASIGDNVKYIPLNFFLQKDTLCIAVGNSYGSHKTGISSQEFEEALVERTKEVFSFSPNIKIKKSQQCAKRNTATNELRLEFRLSYNESGSAALFTILSGTEDKFINAEGLIISKAPEDFVNTHNNVAIPFILRGNKSEKIAQLKQASTYFTGHLPSYFRCANQPVKKFECRVYSPFSPGIRDKEPTSNKVVE